MADGDGELDVFEWRCTDCGRTQPKHNPPCARCGGMSFEKVPVQYESQSDDAGFSRRQYLAYGGAIAGVLALGGYAVLHHDDTPSVSNVPGEADAANGIEFATAEDELRRRLDEERESPLSHDAGAERASTYYTRYLVKNGYEHDPDPGDVSQFVSGRWAAAKNHLTSDTSRAPIDGFDTAAALGRYLAENWLAEADIRTNLVADRYGRFGADIHVGSDGSVYVTTVVV